MASKIPTFNKSYTESQALSFVQNTMNMLNELQDSTDFNTIYMLFQKLTESYFDLNNHRTEICSQLLKSNFVPLSGKFISICHKQGYFLNNDIWFTTFYAINSVWNYSDESRDIAHEILCTDLLNLLISNVLHKPYTKSLQSINIYFLVKSSISIIHNVCRSFSVENTPHLLELKLELVALIKRDDSDFIGIVSMLTLACLVNENELHLLDEGENTIKILIKNIEIALNNENKRINGFAVWELLNGLNRISGNDNLKETIVNENGILTIMNILKSPISENDIENCLGILWNLSFNKNIKTVLIDKFNLKTVVKKFENHKSEKIRKNCEGILWLINNENENRNSLHFAKLAELRVLKKKLKFDVFLSYSWNNKQTVLSIVNELKKLEINIWIDVDQMRSSSLEAMANGIENSKVFVMAISEAYRLSPSCRTEAEYAYFLKKPIIPLIVELKYKPTSWLGLILGSKTYYEFSERRNFLESINGLTKNIYAVLGDIDQIIIDKNPNLDAVDSVKINKTQSKIISSFEHWSNKDVEEWLTKNGLGNFKTNFSTINGKHLRSLIDLNSKTPHFLYETLKSEFGMKLFDILQFKSAVDELIL